MEEQKNLGKYERAHVESLLEKYGYEEDDRRIYLKKITREFRKWQFTDDHPLLDLAKVLGTTAIVGIGLGIVALETCYALDEFPFEPIKYLADEMKNYAFNLGMGVGSYIYSRNLFNGRRKIREFNDLVETMQANEDYVSGKSFDMVPDWDDSLGIDRVRTIPR